MSVDIEDLNLIANKLVKDFFFFKNKKIFLTGGTGFFGKWLLETFIFLNTNHDLNISVSILSRSPDKFKKSYPHISGHENFYYIKGDIKNFQDKTECYDLIIHAATDASSGRNQSEAKLMRSTIMDGAKRICEFANRVQCERILYTSSGAAYGPQPENMSHIPETFMENPFFNDNDAYARAKLDSENYLKQNASCDVVIARCFAFSGPYLPLDGSYAFGNFVNNVLNMRDIVINGDGTAVRSYLYAADLVIWLLRILSSGKANAIYNVGSDVAINIKKLALEIAAGDVGVSISQSDVQGGNRYVPSIEKAKIELELQCYTSLERSIQKTIRFNNK
jgi:nucleoside-diphosphate-sugar epimerase